MAAGTMMATSIGTTTGAIVGIGAGVAGGAMRIRDSGLPGGGKSKSAVGFVEMT
jgi:hypothetical protein